MPATAGATKSGDSAVDAASAGGAGLRRPTARGTAKRLLGPDLIDIVVPQEQAVAPLGWALSAASRQALDDGARRAVADALPLVRSRLTGEAAPPAADVVCRR